MKAVSGEWGNEEEEMDRHRVLILSSISLFGVMFLCVFAFFFLIKAIAMSIIGLKLGQKINLSEFFFNEGMLRNNTEGRIK